MKRLFERGLSKSVFPPIYSPRLHQTECLQLPEPSKPGLSAQGKMGGVNGKEGSREVNAGSLSVIAKNWAALRRDANVFEPLFNHPAATRQRLISDRPSGKLGIGLVQYLGPMSVWLRGGDGERWGLWGMQLQDQNCHNKDTSTAGRRVLEESYGNESCKENSKHGIRWPLLSVHEQMKLCSYSETLMAGFFKRFSQSKLKRELSEKIQLVAEVNRSPEPDSY